MTDLQVKYWTLQEQQRTNLANEAIRQRQNALTERQVASTELLNAQKVQESTTYIDKLQAEIARIEADTKLSEIQRQKAIAEVANSWRTFIIGLVDPFGVVSGVAKTVTKLFSA